MRIAMVCIRLITSKTTSIWKRIMTDKRFEYYAFISYSHKDEKAAKWLHKKLENYPLPSALRKESDGQIPKKIRPVFRDATDLGIGDLRKNLHRELEDSRFLVVVCSPKSARPNAEGGHWVNDEIKRFIELGREDRVVPIIVEGCPDSGDPQTECLPPAIKEHKILAADMTKLGKEKTFLHVVAKILGLKFDRLYQRHLRAERRKNVLRGVLAALVAVGIGVAMDYQREKTAYFADYVEHWGVPVGLVPLTQEQVAHREYSWKSTSQHWKLRKIQRVNSAGGLRAIVDTDDAVRPVMMTFDYAENGKLHKVQECDYLGEVKRIRRYNDTGDSLSYQIPGTHQVNDRLDAGSLTQDFLENNQLAIERKTATAVQGNDFTYDQAGRPSTITNIDANGNKVADSEGIFEVMCSYGKTGQVESIKYLNMHGNPTTLTCGVAGKTFGYSPEGYKISVTYVDDKGLPIENQNFYAIEKRVYDQWGNSTKVTLHAKNGDLVLHDNLYSGFTNEFDPRGNKTKRAYFGLDGKAVKHKFGHSAMAYQYDDRCNLIRQDCLGADKEPLELFGISSTVFKYNTENRPTEVHLLNASGKAASVADAGFAEILVKYKGKNIERVTFLGVDNKPSLTANGFAEVSRSYDQFSKVIKESYLGPDGKPCLRYGGYARLENDYNDNQTLKAVSYFGLDNKLCLIKKGYAKIVYKYDSRGDAIEESYFGRDGTTPVCSKNGYATVKREFDRNGNETKVTYLNEKGQSCSVKERGAGIESEYDEHGNKVSETYLDEAGKPTMTKDGFSSLRNEFNERGKIIKTEYRGLDGKLCKRKGGFAIIRKTIDHEGNVIEKRYFDENDRPCLFFESYSVKKSTYNSKGDEVCTEYFDDEGKRCANDGAAIERMEYYKDANMISIAFFGADEMPCLNVDCVHKIFKVYDHYGNRISKSNFGLDGNPVSDQEGVYCTITEYDGNGEETKEVHYNKNLEVCD